MGELFLTTLSLLTGPERAMWGPPLEMEGRSPDDKT